MNTSIVKARLSDYSNIDFYIRKYNMGSDLAPLHLHEFLQINYISEGNCIHCIEGQEYAVQKGDVFVIPPDVPHCIKKAENCNATVYEIEFSPDFINASIVSKDNSSGISSGIFWDFAYLSPFMVDAADVNPGFTLSEKLRSKIETLFSDMLYEYTNRPSGFEYVLGGLALSMLIFIGREYKKELTASTHSELYITKKQNILDAIEYINTHYSENLSVNDVAKQAFISPSYFKSLFKYFTSKTFVEYLNYVRVTKAANLLRETDLKVIDIALDTGFNYVNHFNRVFKQAMGMTPMQYRKNNLK